MQRKTVTLLFCDVSGSTALGESVDPEALRGVLSRYFERMKEIVERHGGTVEKFIGDAVMAVFGVPVAHEDDALRAVRAAAEMRDALPELEVEARIGVNTGEVVTGTEERLATGDAVNVAARLEQAAEPGEILLGATTLALVHDTVEVEEVEPLALKGKTQPVAAFRLIRVREGPERLHETRFVGRTRELALLREAWERALVRRRCELMTILADAGVGKSRLVDEALASVDTQVVRSRCLPYGEGITYWPVIQVLKQVDVLPSDKTAATAIRSLLGETEVQTSAEEIAWAVRKTFEQAADQLFVVVFDDIHWGEETFLDLVEHVALLSSGAPIVVICMARPELLDRRPHWPVSLRLEPLHPADVEALIPQQISGNLRARIAQGAGGNPLFLTEMLAMTGDAQTDVVVPPTLRALLTARLDRLEPSERRVLERGAVEGEIFHRGSVQTLTPEEPQVTPRLAALVRRELIRPEASQIPGDDGFRFRHLLIRDAAYDMLPKAARAELHERFALWLESRASALVELDEILGYHFEQAWRYRRELGMRGGEPLADRGRSRLVNAGRRALMRQDYAAAVNLLERAVALSSNDELDIALTVDLAEALFFAGRLEDACGTLSAAAQRAATVGDRKTELVARIREGYYRIDVAPEGIPHELEPLIAEAVPLFEASDDNFALYVAHSARAQGVVHTRGLMDEELKALQRSVVYARRAELRHYGAWTLPSLASTRYRGTTSASELLAWLDDQEANGVQDPLLRAFRATALGMLGRFEQARAVLKEVCAELTDRGAKLQLGVATGQLGVELELLAGDPAAAVTFGEEGSSLLEQAGERSFLSTAVGYLAQALFALGRFEVAEDSALRAFELGASDDALTQMLSRQVRAKVMANRGLHPEAERLAREAVTIGAGTDLLNVQADAYSDLAEVLSLAGKTGEAAAAFELALSSYTRKGNIVMAQRTRARLAEVHATSVR